MPDLTIKICGVVVRLSAGDARLVAQVRRRYAPFASRGRPDLSIDVEIVARRLGAERPEPLVTRSGRRRRVERHDLELDLAGSRGRARIVGRISPVDSLLRIALSLALLPRGAFLCHAAAVGGRLFPGRSGAGKSTLGLSVPKRRLLSDELVGVAEGRLHATPFWGDFRAGLDNGSRPMEAIFFLERRSPRGVRRLARADALARLLRCVLCFEDGEAAGRRVLALARRCVSSVPAARTGSRGFPSSSVETNVSAVT